MEANLRNSDAILDELADRAAGFHQRAIDSWIKCAYVLLEAREIASHGQWLRFLQHAGIPERTSQRMLRIARAGLKSDTVSDLGGIRATLDYLSAVDRAMENWRAALAKATEGTEKYDEILQDVPDGLYSGVRWAGDRMDDVMAICRAYGIDSGDEGGLR